MYRPAQHAIQFDGDFVLLRKSKINKLKGIRTVLKLIEKEKEKCNNVEKVKKLGWNCNKFLFDYNSNQILEDRIINSNITPITIERINQERRKLQKKKFNLVKDKEITQIQERIIKREEMLKDNIRGLKVYLVIKKHR